MTRSRQYSEALATVVRRSAIPYGYTITIWTSGAALEHAHPRPGVTQAYLFLVGAVGGFAVVALLGVGASPRRLEPRSGDLVRTGVINAVALSLGLGAAALAALIPGTGAWPAGAFAATTVYLLVASVQLVVVHRGSAPE